MPKERGSVSTFPEGGEHPKELKFRPRNRKKLNVAVSALNQTALAWRQNYENIVNATRAAKTRGVHGIVHPEMAIPGYGCQDRFLAPDTSDRSMQILEQLLPESSGIFMAVGLPFRFEGSLYNGVAFLVDGHVVAISLKKYLAGDGVHYEGRWFKAWKPGIIRYAEVFDELVPIGDVIVDLDGVRFGFETCEEAWVAKRTASEGALRGVDVWIDSSASHFAFGKAVVRRQLIIDGSRRFFSAYLYSNLLGNDSGRMIYDGHSVIAVLGKILAESKRLSFKRFTLTFATIDIDSIQTERARSASYAPEQKAPENLVPVGAFWFADLDELVPDLPAEWEGSGCIKEEEFTRAAALGSFDYLRKSHGKGYATSLSGGADSSATLAIDQKMIELGVQELGLQGFKDELSYIPALAKCRHERALAKVLLLAFYQGTNNSSRATKVSARELAKEVGAKFISFNIEPALRVFLAIAQIIFGRALSWKNKEDDIPLQNLQARVRGVFAWLIANVYGFILVTTGNRSETAVGYCTMDGDTNGGINKIAGVDKPFIIQWLRWMERVGPYGCRRLLSLRYVNNLTPSAELRPKGSNQTDESDLMPYTVLTKIEQIAIVELQTPVDVFSALLRDCAFAEKYSRDELYAWTRKFFRLWVASQWKRERYALSFHYDDHNLDPKTWCRFPVLSGGFEMELEELEEFAKAA